MKNVEKRTEKRVQAKFALILSLPGLQEALHEVESYNISADGLCFRTGLLFPIGTHIELECPTSYGKLKLPAVIVWSRADEYGCRFEDLGPGVRNILKQWLFPPFEP